MRKKNVCKRLAAALALAAVLMTDQSIIYAAGTTDPVQPEESKVESLETEDILPEKTDTGENSEENISEPEVSETSKALNPEEEKLEDPAPQTKQSSPEQEKTKQGAEEEPQAEPEEPPQTKEPQAGAEADPEKAPESSGEDNAPLPEEKPDEAEQGKERKKDLSWQPVYEGTAFDAESFLFEQDVIGFPEEEGEVWEYEESYGKQLSGTAAGALYEALLTSFEGDEEAVLVELEGFLTEDADVQEEEVFAARYEQAAQNAFDAFWYDCADAEELSSCSLRVQYEGTKVEDGSFQWKVCAAWELERTQPEEEPEEEAEPIETEDPEERAAVLKEFFTKVSKAREEDLARLQETGEEQPGDGGETYARMFKRLCDQAEMECVLIKGLTKDAAAVWNAVRPDEENWYLVDIPGASFLTGMGDSEEEERLIYGDFSNSHQGFFVCPVICEQDYSSEEETEEPLPEEVLEEPVTAELEERLSALEQTPEPDEASAADPAPDDKVSEAAPPPEPDEALEAAQTPAPEALAQSEPETDAMLIKSQRIAAPAEKVLTQVSVSSIKVQTYSGKGITPKVTVKDASTGKKLSAGKQYTISYENNVNAGTAFAVIRGVPGSGYDGVLRVNFTIQPQNIKKVKSKVLGKRFFYSGQPVTPEVSATYNKTALSAGKDYQIRYLNNERQGTAQIELTGTGNFTGTKVVKFKISANQMKDASVRLSSYSGVYGGGNAMPSVTVTYGSMNCRENVDYQVVYPKKLKVGKNNITIKGMGSFKGSVKAVYTISQAPMSEVEVHFPYAWQYTGKSLKVAPSSVTLGGVALQARKDYTVKYLTADGRKCGKIKEEGMYQIVLTGKKLFQGTLTFPFCVTSDPQVLGNNYNSAESTIKKPAPPAENDTPEDTSPAEKVEVEKDRYFGYYEGYKIFSKKGIQGVSDYTEDTRAQHVLLNVDMASLISTTERPGYIPYTYQGKTYYFGDLIALKETVYHLHGWGGAGNPYGANHNRNVTFVLLMSWSDELSYLIHPSARKKGAAPYYALNMQEAGARQTYEALFRYLGEEFGAYKTRVSNWTLGNEVNSCKEWNYSGGLSLNDCVANYAQAFQLLSKGVKRAATSSRVFLSLDHCWTASVAGHSGKSYLDQFASYMNQTAPDVQWNVNYHPYSQPLSRVSFWKDNSNTTDSVGTKYISMKNIKVLTDYLAGLESRYGKPGGSIRVIIGELGYTAKPGDASAQREQAAALGYGYYIAMFNTRIDSYIIRAYLDAPEETRSGLYLGLRGMNHEKKTAYDVYQNLDTAQSLSYMQDALSVIGIGSFESAIPGFNADALPAADF